MYFFRREMKAGTAKESFYSATKTFQKVVDAKPFTKLTSALGTDVCNGRMQRRAIFIFYVLAF